MTKSSNNENDRLSGSVVTIVLPHLDNSPWLAFEQQTAFSLYEDLSMALRRLSKKPTADRVHEARVALRRWDCVWNVLRQDGWESDKYAKTVGKELRRIRKLLGTLRDCDVNIEVAQGLGVAETVINKWKYEREIVARHTRKKVRNLKVGRLIKTLRKFLRKRPNKIAHHFDGNGTSASGSAYQHLEPFINSQEEIARELAMTASTPEELHALRLAIKAWRYLLAEFYGLTNLQLVRAQQILGKLNDLHRVASLLKTSESPLANDSLSKLSDQQNKLLDDFTQFRKSLPFGLRPRISSIKGNIKTN